MFLLVFVLLFTVRTAMSQELYQSFYQHADHYREQSLQNRRFKYNDILPLIQELKQNPAFSVSAKGTSVQGREIFLIQYGSGPKKVFLWSQMHGDEPTATAAIFDIFNFLKDTASNKAFREMLQKELTLYIMPMVNPDGAELYQRRNIRNIDLNRDARKLGNPEAKVLMKTFEEIRPHFGFNLHDQSSLYTVGDKNSSAAISFLAPAVDRKQSIPPHRADAMKLIGYLTQVLQPFMPGHTGKYTDEFEPRAFGDIFQSKGAATILVESGGWKNDPEKQFIRKINFVLLLAACNSIALGSYRSVSDSVYHQIPFNDRYLYDLMLRNITFFDGRDTLNTDIGIVYTEKNMSAMKHGYSIAGTIADVGDLSTFYGYTDLDLTDCFLDFGKVFTLKQGEPLPEPVTFYSEGYSAIYPEDPGLYATIHPYPFIFVKSPDFVLDAKPNRNATFLVRKEGKIIYAVVNGQLVDLKSKKSMVRNGAGI